MRDKINTVVVTDVPFWKQETGAHLRIAQLLENLATPPFEVSVLVTRTQPGTELKQVRSSVPLTGLDPSRPPRSGLWPFMLWQFSALAHALGWRETPAVHRRISNYYSRATVRCFQESIRTRQPDLIIFEYVTQTQLLRSLPTTVRNKLVAVVDTHDILWQRASQFEQQGQPHWISVSQEEEEAALREYDLLIAIQPQEAAYFEQVVGPGRVQVTSLEFPVGETGSGLAATSTISSRKQAEPHAIRIGFLASNNWANVDTLHQILDAWPALQQAHSQAELILGGSICQHPEAIQRLKQLESRQVRSLGVVSSVDEFYQQVDLIWNPVRFGTGLKIKNLEAMAFAKCLVTSPHGAEGILAEKTISPGPVTVLDSAEKMIDFLNGKDSSLIRKLGIQGLALLKKEFGPGTQYPGLRQKLGSLLSGSG